MKPISALLPRGSIRRDGLTASIWSVPGRGIGFMVPFFIAAWYGAGSETDAFFFTYGVILFLGNIISALMETASVPFISESSAEPGGIGSFIGRLLGFGFIVVAAATGMVLIVFRVLLPLITRFGADIRSLVWTLFLETAPLVVLMGISGTLAGAVSAMRRFSLPAFSPGIRAMVTLTVMGALHRRLGVHAIPLGYVCGELARLASLAGYIKRFHLFTLDISFRPDEKIRRFFRTAFFQVIGLIVIGIVPLTDIAMASWLGPSSVSLLHYANRLYFIPITILGSVLGAVILSHWSHRYIHDGITRLHTDVIKSLKTLALLSVMVTLGSTFLSQPVVNLIFGYGEITPAAGYRIRMAWMLYLLGLTPQILSMMLIQAHLVLRSRRAPLVMAGLAITLNIPLNHLLMRWFGLSGLPLASSLVQGLVAMYAWRSLSVRILRDSGFQKSRTSRASPLGAGARKACN